MYFFVLGEFWGALPRRGIQLECFVLLSTTFGKINNEKLYTCTTNHTGREAAMVKGGAGVCPNLQTLGQQKKR